MNQNNYPQSSGSIQLGGRKQIVELLKALPSDEREKLLANMRLRNAPLTQELSNETVSFDLVNLLSDQEIQLLCAKISPSILGLALKSSALTTQKRVLSLIPRNLAEEAFEILMSRVQNEKNMALKAKSKIQSVMLELRQLKQITSI